MSRGAAPVGWGSVGLLCGWGRPRARLRFSANSAARAVSGLGAGWGAPPGSGFWVRAPMKRNGGLQVCVLQ